MTDYSNCKYNSRVKIGKDARFEGYCNLPKYITPTGRRLVRCKMCPCEDFEEYEGLL